MRGTVCSMLIVSGLVSLTGRDSAVHEPESKVRQGEGEDGGRGDKYWGETETCDQVMTAL